MIVFDAAAADDDDEEVLDKEVVPTQAWLSRDFPQCVPSREKRQMFPSSILTG
jgi:hypothetical protein